MKITVVNPARTEAVTRAVQTAKAELGDVKTLSGIKPGQMVQAELVKSLGQSEGLLKLAGRLFQAQYPAGLEPGRTLLLKVVQTGPPMILQLPDADKTALARLLAAPTTSFAGSMGALLGSAATGETGELLGLLQRLFQLPEGTGELAGALAEYLQGFGLGHEAVLARGETPGDAKTLLYRLLLLARSQGDEGLEKTARGLLSHIFAHQARSLLGESLIIPLYFHWGGREFTGEIEAEKGGGKAKKAGGQVTVRLNMPALGRVEAGLWWNPTGTAVTLRVEPRHLAPVVAGAGTLRDILERVRGMNLRSFQVEELRPPEPTGARSLLEITA